MIDTIHMRELYSSYYDVQEKTNTFRPMRKESTYNKLVSKGRKLRVIATFPNVTKPWIARAGLPVRIKHAITASLLTIKDTDALESLAKDGFVAGTDEDYVIIRKAIKNNQNFFEH